MQHNMIHNATKCKTPARASRRPRPTAGRAQRRGLPTVAFLPRRPPPGPQGLPASSAAPHLCVCARVQFTQRVRVFVCNTDSAHVHLCVGGCGHTRVCACVYRRARVIRGRVSGAEASKQEYTSTNEHHKKYNCAG